MLKLKENQELLNFSQNQKLEQELPERIQRNTNTEGGIEI